MQMNGPPDPAGARRRLLQRHWRNTRILTAVLLVLWLAVTLGLGLFARELSRISFFGWPLSYYMGAQGALIVFLLIIGCHCLVMNRLDRRFEQNARQVGKQSGEAR
jgi:putative solute:sodium symporter small subunit